MKTKEERNALKEEAETLNKKLHKLTEEELEKVTGGTGGVFEQNPDGTYNLYDGQEFNIGRTCQVTGTYLNATLNTTIHFEYYEEYILPTGERFLESGHRTCALGYIISNLY